MVNEYVVPLVSPVKTKGELILVTHTCPAGGFFISMAEPVGAYINQYSTPGV
jgi:hypothetical protein